MKSIILVLVALLLMVSPAISQPTYNVGDTVDDFTLDDAYGNSVSLSDYPDQIVLLAFWDPY